MARIVVLNTGGTIASRYSADHAAVVSEVEGEEMIRKLNLPPSDIVVESEQFSNVGSYAISLETAFALAQRIDAVLARTDVAGVVVTHGTDTMEESAYLSDLVVRSDKPVVFTGAQRTADHPSSDGPGNLADAIRVAHCPDARGLGTVIVFEQEIHAAREATKIHTSRTGTFASDEHGKLGEIDGRMIIVHRQPARRGTIATGRIEPNIGLIKMAMGVDGGLVECVVRSGARALVLEAFGRGNATPAVTAAVRDAIRSGVSAVVTSRCPQGRVTPVYGAGGGADLAAAGAIFAGDLSAVKTRILLALLVGAGADPAAIRESVERHGA